MTRSAPARKPDPVSALLALRMQARGFPRGWSVSPYRGRARLRVTSKGAETEPSRAELPPAEESTWASDPDSPINWGALIEAYRQRKISSGELKSSTWDKIWQPGMREVLAVMHRHPSPGDSRQLLEAVTHRWSQQPGARGRQMRVQQTAALLRWGVDGERLP